MTDYTLLEQQAGFAEVVEALVSEPVYAIDTEFHREKTYYPKVALVQIAWPGHLVLVDPLEVSLAPLAKVLDGPGLAVLHAASQDLEVLDLECGTVPSVLFDTQLAAGFMGMRSPSLASLHDQVLGVRLPKSDRLTDWLQRPLQPAQLDYAASDVRHLLQIRDHISSELERSGRLGWAEEECERLRTKSRNLRDPAEAWRKMKDSKQLKGKSRGVAKAVAQWREQRAANLDIPPRFVLSDLAIVAMAQRPPDDVGKLKKVRGIDDRHLRGGAGEAILEAVAIGRNTEVSDPPRPAPNANLRDLRPIVSLIASWMSQHAGDIEMDPALIGSRADIEALLRRESGALMAVGWRHELVGKPIEMLTDGDAAVAFGADSRLVLEQRSHQPLGW
jgi:ribonuclease D